MPPALKGLRVGLNGEAGLPGLGSVMCCQQNGDCARTRPVLVARDWAETSTDSWEGPIPDREWGIFREDKALASVLGAAQAVAVCRFRRAGSAAKRMVAAVETVE
jgi:hypothetical protein